MEKYKINEEKELDTILKVIFILILIMNVNIMTWWQRVEECRLGDYDMVDGRRWDVNNYDIQLKHYFLLSRQHMLF